MIKLRRWRRVGWVGGWAEERAGKMARGANEQKKWRWPAEGERRRTTWLERQKVIWVGTLPSFSSCPAFILLFHSAGAEVFGTLKASGGAGTNWRRKFAAESTVWIWASLVCGYGARAYDYFLLIWQKNTTEW